MSGKVDNDNVWDLTKLLDVVLLPSDVQEEHLLVLVLGEDFLLDPGKLFIDFDLDCIAKCYLGKF